MTQPIATTIRIPDQLFAALDAALQEGGRDALESEVAGFLLGRPARLPDGRTLLVASAWHPVPVALRLRRPGFGLAWRAEFNAAVGDEAERTGSAAVLLHRHSNRWPARLSPRDLEAGRPLMAAMSKNIAGIVGMAVYNNETIDGELWERGARVDAVMQIAIPSAPIRHIAPRARSSPRSRLVRQSQAIGSDSDGRLAGATVTIVGLSGGGSHIAQQLAHQGFGTFFLIDDQPVEAGNRGRLVGSRHDDDGVLKTRVAARMINGIDPAARVVEVEHRTSHPDAIAAIAGADLVVAAVDTFAAREQINALCRRYAVPLIDLGMALTSEGEKLVRADGQVVLTLPGHPCMRCLPLLSDAVLRAEALRRRPGYDDAVDALGDPQVVSMNGLIASHAANVALAMVTGYLPASTLGAGGYWQYDGISGELTPSRMPPRRRNCPGCAEDGQADFVQAA
jgi:molybdopterin/thiamine biosynthesis adenylyltransferase